VLVLGIVATGWLVRHSTSRHTSVASSPATESSATSTLPVGQTSTTADAVEGDQPNPVQVTGYAIGDRPDPNKPAPGPDDRPYWIAVTDTNTFLVVGYVLGADMFGPPSDGSVPLIVYDEDGRRVGILAEGGFVPDN
jgi:hypothetical protein